MKYWFESVVLDDKKEIRLPSSDVDDAKERSAVFPYPPVGSDNYGPNKYIELAAKLRELGLSLPTGPITADLLFHVYSDRPLREEPAFQEMRKIIQRNGLWVYNVNLWTDKGVYVIQDTLGEGKTHLSIKELEDRLKGGCEDAGVRFSSDKAVRFAPRGSYAKGIVSFSQFCRDGFVIASLDKEKARNLEIETFTSREPTVHTLSIPEGAPAQQRVTVINEEFGRFDLSGDVIQFKSDRRFAYGYRKEPVN